MDFADKVVKTIKTTSILFDFNALFGETPSDQDAAYFVSELIELLVEKQVAPDAIGYNGIKGTVTLTYSHLAELGKVHLALTDTVKAAKKKFDREMLRRKTLHRMFEQMEKDDHEDGFQA